MTPEQFIGHWSPGGGGYGMNERAGAQSHFMGLCELLGVDAPNHSDDYTFEKGTVLLEDRQGFADVYKRDRFAWEYKRPGGDLTAAVKRLRDYAAALSNPPLLIVSDRIRIEIHTQFTGFPTEVQTVWLAELVEPSKRDVLRRCFEAPESFKPGRTNRDITEDAAAQFSRVAKRMRVERGEPADKVAHFLTQCVFCFFAEDVGLLPERLFERLLARDVLPERMRTSLGKLFEQMNAEGETDFGADWIPWFNGGLFQHVDVPMLTPADLKDLHVASRLNWGVIDAAIVGTLFERGLDPSKMHLIGVHYTDPATIMRIITPVVERPLRAEWEVAKEKIRKALGKSKFRGADAPKTVRQPYFDFLRRLADYRVLDPACGSGNFLYLALKTLKDIENDVHVQAESLGLIREIDLVVGPHNVLGIELNEYAAELARVSVWIGELQWRLQNYLSVEKNPILKPLDHIECRDALLTPLAGSVQVPSPAARGDTHVASGSGAEGEGDDSGEPTLVAQSTALTPTLSRAAGEGVKPAAVKFTEALWPRADAVIGNPPFVGGSKKRRELGDETFVALAKIYEGRVPPGADLVCYWFDKALQQMKRGELARAGFVSTNSIRGGSNRDVLDAIVKDGVISDAWSDEPWVNDGAAVRVSLVCFETGAAAGQAAWLNGESAARIAADLTGGTDGDLTGATSLQSNSNVSFQGASKKAKFEIPDTLARSWLAQPNPNGRPNSDVLKPWANGFELSRRPQLQWIIDFGIEMSERDAALYEAPFRYLTEHVRPEREKNNREAYRKYWWRFAEPRPGLRRALKPLSRFIATIAHSKYRFFVWLSITTSPDQALITVARADDATFGILHSHFHELWSLRLGTSLEDRPRYTPTTCFETFPFPTGLTPRDTAHQRTEVLADGAVIPAFYSPLPQAPAPTGASVRRGLEVRVAGGTVSAIDMNSPVNDHPHPSPLPLAGEGIEQVRNHAIAIARAATRLNDLRERWLNPPEWTEAVPEVVPLGLDKSPYPDRILPRANLGAADLGELKKRTLTNLYNQRPAWLADAHEALDAAVAAAYGWTDYSAAMTDNEILVRLLALNHERAAQA